ncbi:TPA_asm: hypothetical protein [Paris polyphylla amalgavirus 1]|nr:TPA_asm: hypothetical protein [Paris polyphylla amalgavirus 1]
MAAAGVGRGKAVLDFAVDPLDNDKAEVAELAVPLLAIGLSPVLFDWTILLRHGVVPKVYASRLRIFRGKETAEQLDTIMGLGITNRIFPGVRACSVTQWLTFLDWLRSKPGQDALSALAHADRLRARGKGVFSAEDSAFVSMFDAQRNDFLLEVGERRKASEVTIATLRRQIEVEQKALEDNLATTGQQFLPCSEYVPLSNYDYNTACWDLYVRKCEEEGQIPEALDVPSLTEASKVFGEEVQKTHLLAFLAQAGRKQVLRTYVETKIQGLEETGDHKQAKRFRLSLDIVGGGQAAAPLQTAQAPALPTDAGGAAQPVDPETFFNQTAVDRPGFALDQPGTSGTQADAPSVPAQRNLRSSAPLAFRQRPGRSRGRGIR